MCVCQQEEANHFPGAYIKIGFTHSMGKCMNRVNAMSLAHLLQSPDAFDVAIRRVIHFMLSLHVVEPQQNVHFEKCILQRASNRTLKLISSNALLKFQ